MNFNDPSLLFSGFLIGTIGVGLFMYGKKAGSPRCLGIGAVLCVFPSFVHSVMLMWLLAAGLVGSLVALVKWS